VGDFVTPPEEIDTKLLERPETTGLGGVALDPAVSVSVNLSAGTVMQDRYVVLRVLALGGNSTVYVVQDQRFSASQRLCAMKEILDPSPDPAVRQRNLDNFEREANLLASLSHPAIPKIYDYFNSGDRVYMVMESIDGKDLETILEQTGGPLPERDVIDWAIQLCEVLSYLHSRRPPVIFRDLKPANVMLTPAGRIVLVDFGIAKIFQGERKGTMVGTEGYSPPEQYKGMAEPRSDIYALGATMHHLLTASDPRHEVPFSFHERPLRKLNPTISPSLETVVQKALAYTPEERYSSAAEMRQALIQAGGGGTGLIGAAPTGTLLGSDARQLWNFTCEDEIRGSAVIADSLVLFGCYDHNLYALDIKSGSFVWKFAGEAGICATPALYKDSVIVGCEDNSVYSINIKTGKQNWVFRATGAMRSSPRIQGDTIYIGSDDRTLYALDARFGRRNWRYNAWKAIRSTPAVAAGMVYVGSDDGHLHCVDAQTGMNRWRISLNGPIISSPFVAEDLIIVGSTDNGIYALEALTGFQVWKLMTGGSVSSSPLVTGGRVYIGSADHYLYCVDIKTGKTSWRAKTGGPVTSSPRHFSGNIYVGSNDGHVYAFDARSGQERWKFRTGGPVTATPLIHEGIIYVGSTDNKFYALQG